MPPHQEWKYQTAPEHLGRHKVSHGPRRGFPLPTATSLKPPPPHPQGTWKLLGFPFTEWGPMEKFQKKEVSCHKISWKEVLKPHACPSAPRSRPSIPGSQDAAVLRSADSEVPGAKRCFHQCQPPPLREEGKGKDIELMRVIYTTC